MKKEKATLVIAVLLIAITGCGNKTEQLVESTEVIAEPKDYSNTETDGESDESKNETDNEENQEDLSKEDMSAKETSEEESLEGTVKSINENDNFVVISKIFTEELDGGGELAVAAGAGDKGEELITVYFTEETRFQIKTVKNAGEEVTEKEGDFSDIKEESILNFKGNMDDKGEEFLATDVVIYEFV